MAIAKLDTTERDMALARLTRWALSEDGRSIGRTFKFATFREAFAFMTRVAMLAEMQDHHPEWSNVYNRVTISLTTHDAGGLTARDIALADAIDAEARAIGRD